MAFQYGNQQATIATIKEPLSRFYLRNYCRCDFRFAHLHVQLAADKMSTKQRLCQLKTRNLGFIEKN